MSGSRVERAELRWQTAVLTARALSSQEPRRALRSPMVREAWRRAERSFAALDAVVVGRAMARYCSLWGDGRSESGAVVGG